MSTHIKKFLRMTTENNKYFTSKKTVLGTEYLFHFTDK